MKKLVVLSILLIFSVIFSLKSLAAPYYSTTINPSAIGVLKVFENTKIYKEPNENSQILLKINLNNENKNFTKIDDKNICEFLAILNNKDNTKIAFLTVQDLQENWFLVCFNKEEDMFGWVKATDEDFISWFKFYNHFGKQNGVYIFKDVPSEYKRLFSQPDERAQRVEGFSYANKIKLVMLKGNWMLVRILDVGNKEKIGYIRWRKDDGTILMFPKL